MAQWIAVACVVAALPPDALAQPDRRRGAVSFSDEVVITVPVGEGEVITAGTCGLRGAEVRGDTVLRLRAPGGAVVRENDDACGGLGSSLRYGIPSGGAGDYQIVASCYGSASCGGVVAYETGPAPPSSPRWRVASSARALVALDRPGGALVLDAVVEVRALELLVLRLAGAPMALAGGELGGIAAGALSLVAGFDLGLVEVGIGGGAAVLATRLGEPGTKEVATLVMHGRLGRFHMFNVEGQLTLAHLGGMEIFSIQLLARLPLDAVELSLRGAGGHDGVGLGELSALIWLMRERARPVFGVSVHAGGAGVFYQPVCRFGAGCADTRWYAGLVVGAGIEWRP